MDLAVAAGGGVERIGRGVVHPAVGALGTGIGILVIPVGQIAGQVGRGEGLQVTVIKGLNGIHVGVGHLDVYKRQGMVTVEMKGQGFTSLTKEGAKVKAGTPLLKVDLEAIRAAGHPLSLIHI